MLWSNIIQPRLISLACTSKPICKQRSKVIPFAKGEVLEIGFGSGHNLPYYNQNEIKSLIGLEPSLSMQKLSSERLKDSAINFRFLTASAEEIPLKTESIDTVVCTYTLCSIPKPELALSEINRVLKPNGILAILEFCRPKNSLFQKLFSFYFNNIIPIIGKVLTGEKLFDYLPESVNNFFSKNELLEKIETFGFKNTYAKNLTFGICSIVIGTKSNSINQ